MQYLTRAPREAELAERLRQCLQVATAAEGRLRLGLLRLEATRAEGGLE